MGRLQNDVNLGHEPTAGKALQRLCQQFERQRAGIIRVADLCCADGTAIAQLALPLQAKTYGSEIHEERAIAAKKILTQAYHEDVNQMICSDFAQLHLYNPPYAYAVKHEDETAERVENKMYDRIAGVCQKPKANHPETGGILIMIVSAHNLVWGLCKKFTRQYQTLRIWKYPDTAFNQVIIVGQRKAKAIDDPETELLLNLVRTEGEIRQSMKVRMEWKYLFQDNTVLKLREQAMNLPEPEENPAKKIIVPIAFEGPFRFYPWTVPWHEIGERFDESPYFKVFQQMIAVQSPDAEKIPMLMPPRLGHLLPLLKTMGSTVLRDRNGQNPLLIMLREERDIKKWEERTETKYEKHQMNPNKEFLTAWDSQGNLVVFQ